VLVDVDVHGLSMLSARASWAELGIPPGDVRRERLRRGNKDLFPEHARQFRSLETRFRGSLDKHSFVLEGFRPYRWIPFTAYETWREEWDRLQGEWAGVLADLLDHYDEIVAEERATAAEIAREAWDALLARHKTKTNGDADSAPVIVIGGREFSNRVPAAFVEHVQERATARIPAGEDLAGGLYVDYRTALVLSGADLEAEYLRRERTRTERERERARQAEVQARAHTAQEREWAAQRQLALEVEEQERQVEMRLQAERRRLQAMHEAEMEHARQQLDRIISPLDEVFQQLRAQIHRDVTEITASIERNGHLRGKVAERARNLVETFRLLNAHGDEALESALDDLKERLAQRPVVEQGKKAPRYNTEAVLGQLSRIKVLTHQAATDVAQRAARPTRARALEL
ncbi:MAG: hypothetical protein PVF45_02110, partial [Anaerolineae bacterium]